MNIMINKLNTACLFHAVNQWDETITKMMCTHYFAFINAKYNWVIKSFTEDDIKASAKLAYDLWTFDYEKWGKLSDWVTWVIRYLKEVKWINCNLLTITSDWEAREMLEKWYAVWLWIKVNNKFYPDKVDWKLDLLDYKGYRWNIWHATNVIKWTCRWKFDCTDNWEEMFLDSYFWKSSTYKCNIKEVFQDIDMTTKFVLF